MNASNTQSLRNRMLKMFPAETYAQIQPILDSIIQSADRDGVMQGRKEAAAMIEVLVMGDADLDMSKLNDLMRALRDEAHT